MCFFGNGPGILACVCALASSFYDFKERVRVIKCLDLLSRQPEVSDMAFCAFRPSSTIFCRKHRWFLSMLSWNLFPKSALFRTMSSCVVSKLNRPQKAEERRIYVSPKLPFQRTWSGSLKIEGRRCMFFSSGSEISGRSKHVFPEDGYYVWPRT
jgi:hypothetical protein